MAAPHPRPWAALQHSNFALLAGGQLVSQIGDGMQQIVVAWQIYDLSGSALGVGLTGLARAIPLMAFSPIGGVVADSVDRRRLLVITQTLAMACTLVLAALTSGVLITPWMIYALILLTAATRSFDNPARQALVPTLVPTEHINSAVNLLLAVRHTGAILGPALGGLLIATVGVASAYWISAASFLALIAALLAMRIAAVIGRTRPRVSPGMLAEGMRFIWGAPVVLSLLAIDFINTGFGTTRSAWPTFARDVFDAGAQGLGLLGSSTSVGAILGLGAALALGDVRRKGLGVVLCSLGFGLSVLCFAVSPTLLIAGIGLAGVGFADAVNDSMSHTLLLTVTPDELRGRVNSVGIMLTQGGPSLGQLWVGFLVSALGPREGVAIGGVVVVVFALSLLVFARPLIRYGRATTPATS